MTRFPFATIGFDLDGTLVDSTGDLADAVNHARGSIGRPALPDATIAPMIGGGARRLLRLALEIDGAVPAGFDALHDRMIAYYADHLADRTLPFPGAIAAIDALRARGVRIALATNKLEALTHRLLDALAIADRFDCVLGGDTLGPDTAKPAPAMLDALRDHLGGPALFVGDSRYDAAAAAAAGMPCVIVDRGETEPLAGASATIGGFDELVPLLDRWNQTGR